jgi:hypothetical protein
LFANGLHWKRSKEKNGQLSHSAHLTSVFHPINFNPTTAIATRRESVRKYDLAHSLVVVILLRRQLFLRYRFSEIAITMIATMKATNAKMAISIHNLSAHGVRSIAYQYHEGEKMLANVRLQFFF